VSAIAQSIVRCIGTLPVLQVAPLTEVSMVQQRVLSKVHDARWEARDRYRWLLLTGLFVLTSSVFAFVIAMPTRVSPPTEILIAVAALALVAYNMAIKRYWAVGVGLLMALIAVMGWIVAR
jgi:hypothetical protein